MGKFLAAFFTSAIIVQASFAEVIKIPVGAQATENQDIALPKNGETRERVESHYGAPEAINDAVGEPPISSWQYRDYIVYFEYDRVLHSVLKHKPQQPITTAE